MTADPTDIKLTPSERHHPLWMKLKGFAEAKLARARALNDSPTLDAAATAALRGEIRTYKALIALDVDPAVTE